MRTIPALLFVLALIGCPGTGPGAGPGACTEIGCEDGFTIEVSGPAGEDVGGFQVVVTIDGVAVAGECAAGSWSSYDTFRCGPGTILVLGSATEVELDVQTLDGAMGWEGVLQPEFGEVQPNGEGCPPVCLQDQDEIVLEELGPVGPVGTEVDAIGEEEVCGGFAGARPSITLDSLGQPHIVTDTGDPGLGAELVLYHRLAGDWQEEQLATASDPPVASAPASIAEPHLEIDPYDRAWVSAHYFRSNVYEACGVGVFMIDEVATQPELAWFDKFNIVSVGWSNGNLSLDPWVPDSAVVMTYDGEWGEVDRYGDLVQQGQMYIGNSGEKVRFLIAPRAGEAGVWHGITSGWPPSPSAYQNSVRDAAGAPIVVWASCDTYPIQGEDTRHPGLGFDRADPEVAYISAIYEPGLVINVYDGEQMVWPNTELPVIDASPDYVDRFGPQWAPAMDGGAFLAWSRDGRIKLRYVGPDGALGDEVDVCDGSHCSLVTDEEGAIHLAYLNGGTRYRRITTR